MQLPAVEIVPVRLLPILWPQAKQILEPALALSNYTSNEVETLLYRGDMQLWLSKGPVMVSHAQGELMTILLMAGGSLEDYRAYFSVFEDMIKPWGFKRLEIVGRPGWQKFFRNEFKLHAVHLRKEI